MNTLFLPCLLRAGPQSVYMWLHKWVYKVSILKVPSKCEPPQVLNIICYGN